VSLQDNGRWISWLHLHREVSDFYLFIKHRCETKAAGESALLSENSLAEDWLGQAEDEAGKNFQ